MTDEEALYLVSGMRVQLTRTTRHPDGGYGTVATVYYEERLIITVEVDPGTFPMGADPMLRCYSTDIVRPLLN